MVPFKIVFKFIDIGTLIYRYMFNCQTEDSLGYTNVLIKTNKDFEVIEVPYTS